MHPRYDAFLRRRFRAVSMGSKQRTNRYQCFPRVECLEDRTVLNGGLPDPTFGVNGQVLVGIGKPALPDLPLPVRSLVPVVNQPDGKLVVAYDDVTTLAHQTVLRRFNEDGSPDLSFGDQGTVHTDGFFSVALAVQLGGKLDAVGSIPVADGQGITLVKQFMPDGSLDMSFGVGGQAQLGTIGFASDIFTQSDGKIVIAGGTRRPVDGSTEIRSYCDLVRLTSDGSLDSSFGQNGIMEFLPLPGELGLTAIGAQADGRIIVALAGAGSAYLRRFNTDGSPDSSFGSSGVLTLTDVNIGGNSGLAIYPDGRILFAGYPSIPAQKYVIKLARITVNGHLDTTFGINGVVMSSFAEPSGAAGVALQSDGRIVVGGFVQINGMDTMLFTRFDPNGSTDTTFGTNGLTEVQGNFSVTGLAVGADNKVVAIGPAQQDASENQYLGLVRLTADENAPSASQAFVTQAYLDLLSRHPDSAGMTFWIQTLAQGVTRANVALALQASSEGIAHTVGSLYATFLHRAADPAGLALWSGFLITGGSREQLALLLLGSQEYQGGLTDGSKDGFLNALYSDALNRPVDPLARTFWDQLFAAGQPTSLAATVVFSSAEYHARVIQEAYGRYLRRPADESGLAFFTSAIASGARDEQVIASLVGSNEYSERLSP